MAKGGKRSKTALPNAYSKPRKGCPQPMGLTKLGASTNVTLFFIPLKKNKKKVSWSVDKAQQSTPRFSGDKRSGPLHDDAVDLVNKKISLILLVWYC